MNKREFLDKLREGLCGLPREDVEERVTFYGEMIDDRMEEGMSEDEAVADVGAVEDIVAQIVSEYPLSRLVKARVKPKRTLEGWEILLLILGSPVWLSLLIGAISVIVSLYAAIWSVVITLGAVFVSLAACLFGGVVLGIALAVQGRVVSGFAVLGAALVCAGVAILVAFLCQLAVKGTLLLTKKTALGIKKIFMKRGNE